MKAIRYVRLFSFLTLIFIYLVILAGSIVRTTGSGMGCPDWPKCFGQWVPPTELSQLPEGYEQTFLDQRKEKLEKYIGILDALGADDLAEKMRADDSLLRAEPFDAVGTWIEYFNRVVGFISGNLMLILFIFTLLLAKSRPRLAIMAFISLVAISFQAWLGAVVVATNLTPWVITVHMMVAFLIIALLISIFNNLKGGSLRWKSYRPLMVLSLVVTLIQVVFGTQVRQEVDHIKHLGLDRMDWISQLSEQFELHRSFSIVLLLINAYLVYVHWNVGRSWRILAGVILLEIVAGLSLSYLGMPKIAQPAHLILATTLFGWQWYIHSDRRPIPRQLETS